MCYHEPTMMSLSGTGTCMYMPVYRMNALTSSSQLSSATLSPVSHLLLNSLGTLTKASSLRPALCVPGIHTESICVPLLEPAQVFQQPNYRLQQLFPRETQSCQTWGRWANQILHSLGWRLARAASLLRTGTTEATRPGTKHPASP